MSKQPPQSAKIIVRIKGGLGNQLFCYAAARRLALANNAELVIDDVTGFVRDIQYRRQYALGNFSVLSRKATVAERMEPFERYRRGFAKLLSRQKPFPERDYLEEEGNWFDPRMLGLKVKGTLYLDGLWQNEKYFKDVEETIREDLRIIPPQDNENILMSEQIASCNAVSIHVRWFDFPDKMDSSLNLLQTYYTTAVSLILEKVSNPHFFIFSDKPNAACKLLGLSSNLTTLVRINHGDVNAYADLWLMAQCKHFIIANSTFSWWGAWLSASPGKNVIAPRTGFGSTDSLPREWIGI